MAVLFVAIFLLIFYFLRWLLYTLAQGDISKMYHWTIWLNGIMLSVSFFMWIYESMHTGEWLDLKNNNYAFVFFSNFLFLIILLVVWLLLCKLQNKKSRRTLKYGIICYDSQLDFQKDYQEGRVSVLLTFYLIFIPCFNIFAVFQFIKEYFM